MPTIRLLRLKISNQPRKPPPLFCQFAKVLALFAGCSCAHATETHTASDLTTAIHATLAHHPALIGKQNEVSAKQYVSKSARAQRLPTLSADAASYDDDTNPATVRIRQPLWAFGRIQDTIDVADADLKIEEADLLRVQRQLVQQTTEAYVRLQGAKQRLQITTENADALDALHGQVSRRQSGNLASAADVRLSLARLTQANVRKERLLGDVRITNTELLALTQIPVQVNQRIPQLLTTLPTSEESEALAQANSTELKLQSQRVHLARANAARERTASMPTFYLQAEYQHRDNEFEDDNETRFGVVLEGRLEGLSFVTVGRSKAAGANLQASQQALNSTRIEVRKNIRSLISNRETQQKMIDTLQVSVTELTEILASYQRQYEAGHKAWLDVLNIQRELTEQRIQQSQAMSDLLIYSTKLLTLVGAFDSLTNTQRD